MSRLSLWWFLFITALQTFCHGQTSDYKLVWSDEFDYSGYPDSTKWGYETGYVRNQEPQLYTAQRLENARVEDGILTIEARKEPYPAEELSSGSDPKRKVAYNGFTSASLYTLFRPGWAYGRIEVRAKLPSALGVWPAIWTLGSNRAIGWPQRGEIDIMEYFGRGDTVSSSSIHYEAKGKHAHKGQHYAVPKLTDEFHIFRLDWMSDRIDFFVDDIRYHSIPITKKSGSSDGDLTAFSTPHYLLLNLALQRLDSRYPPQFMSQKFLIDYVRIYQRD